MTNAPARPLAVVTGASSGIGLELAKTFAENGFDLLVAAENSGIVEAGAALRDRGAETTTVQADLATPDGVEQLVAAIAAAGRPVDVVALNAGVGVGGDFATQTDLDAELKMIDLNVRSTVHLAKRVLPGMVERGEGRVLFTSSIASTMPGPFEAVYAATKSFVQSFAEALREELKDTGVTVTSLMPGPTETEFFHRGGMDDTRVGQMSKDDPAQVAKEGFAALMGGQQKVVAGGLMTKVQGYANKLTPDTLKAKGHRVIAEPGSGSGSGEGSGT